MPDARFFRNHGPVTLEETLQLTGAEPPPDADRARAFADVAPLESAGNADISFLDNVKYIDAFAHSKAGACFARRKFAPQAPAGMIVLATDDPYYCYALTAQRFYPDAAPAASLSPQAQIDPSAELGPDCAVGAFCVIGPHVKIGRGTRIAPGAVIGSGVVIGEECDIGAGVTISHSLVGHRVRLHPGVHLGQDGFGFAIGKKGIAKIPQLGRVIIEDDVEIGAGSCVDRGTGPDTVIGAGSKIDNLVQIGHNVRIGRSVIIAGQAGISGSTQIGDGAMLGGQAGVAGHLKIGAMAKLAAQSGVMHDMPPGAAYGGSPAVPIRDWHRQTLALGRLSGKTEDEHE